MTNIWDPECSLDMTEARKLIEEQFPELDPVEIVELGKGFDNTIFRINNEFVFRFPRRKVAVELLETEVRLLPELVSVLPLSIPEPVFFGQPSQSYPWPFTGYKLVKGRTPESVSFEKDNETVERLAKFLGTLHQFPIHRARELGVPNDQFDRLNIVKRKPKVVEHCNRVIELGLLENQEQLNRYISELESITIGTDRVLVHGDLHIRNLIVDSTGTLSGVIDWGDSHIGHPANDFSIIYSFLTPSCRSRFFEIYGNVDLDSKKLAQFKAVYTSLVLLLYAWDLKDQVLIMASKNSIKNALTL